MEHLIVMKKKDSNPDMKAFQFCIKALDFKNKYNNRIFIDHLLILDGFVYGTDLRRLHRAKLDGEYKNGIYQVFTKLKNHICIAHEFEKTEENYLDLTTITEYGEVKTLFNFHFGPGGGEFSKGLTEIIRALPKNQTINPNYLSCFDDYFDVKIKPAQVILKNDTRLAIIMVMNHDPSTAY